MIGINRNNTKIMHIMCVCTCTRWAEIWVHLRIDVRYSISDNFWYFSLEFSSFNFALFLALICERTTFILDEFCNIPHVVHSIESISSAFVIVVWGRNFKYSLSINSKQNLANWKFMHSKATPHTVHISKYGNFSHSHSHSSLVPSPFLSFPVTMPFVHMQTFSRKTFSSLCLAIVVWICLSIRIGCM